MTSVAVRIMSSALVAVLGVGLASAGCDAGYSIDQGVGADASPSSDGAASVTSDGAAAGDAANGPLDSATIDAAISLDLGTGADGAYTAGVLDSSCFGRIAGTAGSSTLTYSGPGKLDNGKLTPGAVLMVHQTQGPGAGNYELVTVQNPPLQKTLALAKPLAHTYAEPGAQIVIVRQFTDVTIALGQTVNVLPWDGQCGGILPILATAKVSIAGTLDVSAHGFRGSSHVCNPINATYQCNAGTPDLGAANGFSGESELGTATPSNVAHGSGGGGGMDGSDCGMGGGGSHGSAGTAGPNGGGQLPCRSMASKQNGGAPGAVLGVADLTQSLLFGGAGGEGGGDEDGAVPGGGGSGGGIVFIRAKQIVVTGTIASDGAAGATGVTSGACGGGGPGMGGGGGGAGGTIRLAAYTVDLSAGKVGARGGIGGACGGVPGVVGGVGGAGRIGILSQGTKGSTTPPFDPR